MEKIKEGFAVALYVNENFIGFETDMSYCPWSEDPFDAITYGTTEDAEITVETHKDHGALRVVPIRTVCSIDI